MVKIMPGTATVGARDAELLTEVIWGSAGVTTVSPTLIVRGLFRAPGLVTEMVPL
jgi:hypothetical protein